MGSMMGIDNELYGVKMAATRRTKEKNRWIFNPKESKGYNKRVKVDS
jgi:hypothetical protein